MAPRRTTKPAAPAVEAPRAATADGDIQFFSTTVIKLDANGNEVMSDHLAPGERLRRDVHDRHLIVKRDK